MQHPHLPPFVKPCDIPNLAKWNIFYICGIRFYTQSGVDKKLKDVVSSAPAILRPQVRIPSTPSTLFQFVIDLWCEKDKNKRKRGRDLPIFLKIKERCVLINFLFPVSKLKRNKTYITTWSWCHKQILEQCSSQSYKASMLVIYDSESRTWLENTPYYNSRVVNYERKLFIRLATGMLSTLKLSTLIG